MAEKLVMLALSPTMEEGQLVKWLVEEGATVEAGDVIAEVETDKATMELESFVDGIVLKQLVAEGDTVPVGNGVAIVGDEGEDISDLLSDAPAAPAANDTSDDANAAPAAAAPTAPTPAPAAPSSDEGRRLRSSPLARKMAQEAGLELAAITGSGPQGRVIKRDVEAAIAAQQAQPTAAPRQAAAPAASPTYVWAEDVEPTPLSGMRRTIARRLTEVWVNAPHFFLERPIEMDAALAFRKQLNNAFSRAEIGKKISVNDIIVKACALALQDHPEINVAFADDGMRSFDGSHIGVAVAVPEGLIVPVIRDAHIKSLSAISAETRELAGKARERKLRPEEMQGATFSISNLGMFGIDRFTAVINPPAACILAVGASTKTPVVRDNDEIAIANLMRVTLSCDHRAVDGATGARFLQTLKTYLEEPMLLVG